MTEENEDTKIDLEVEDSVLKGEPTPPPTTTQEEVDEIEAKFADHCPSCTKSHQWTEPQGGVVKLHPFFLCTSPLSPKYGLWVGGICFCEEYHRDEGKMKHLRAIELQRRGKGIVVPPRGIQKKIAKNSIMNLHGVVKR